jgi:hypothetical protein
MPARRSNVVVLIYGDESADETKERVFAVAGVVGYEEAWASLEEKWRARCGGIPFHANDCESNRGDFEGFPDPENKRRYREFTTLLADSGLGGYGIALDLMARHEVFPDIPPTQDYYKCFLELIERMRNFADYNGETAKFTFDMRPEGPYNSGVLYSIARNSKDWKPYLDSEIGFAVARDNPRVQVADLFAREVMKALDNRIGPVKRVPRKSWLCLSDTKRFHMEVYTREWFLDLKKNLPKLEMETGMSMLAYAQWLKDTKRKIDNISNRFAYMKHVIERDGE